ncbi:hypothetical protein CR513_31417, partial [Mucuna pruriens]
MSNKKKLKEFEVVNLIEECSIIVLKKLPPKLKDSGCFIISCTMGNSHFYKALCDLGTPRNPKLYKEPIKKGHKNKGKAPLREFRGIGRHGNSPTPLLYLE